jgi:hypothetical protein
MAEHGRRAAGVAAVARIPGPGWAWGHASRCGVPHRRDAVSVQEARRDLQAFLGGWFLQHCEHKAALQGVVLPIDTYYGNSYHIICQQRSRSGRQSLWR